MKTVNTMKHAKHAKTLTKTPKIDTRERGQGARPVIININMEGKKPINRIKPINMEGTRPPTGASPTQPYKCGQYVKVKVKTLL